MTVAIHASKIADRGERVRQTGLAEDAAGKERRDSLPSAAAPNINKTVRPRLPQFDPAATIGPIRPNRPSREERLGPAAGACPAHRGRGFAKPPCRPPAGGAQSREGECACRSLGRNSLEKSGLPSKFLVPQTLC
jgi:hypothetical protein